MICLEQLTEQNSSRGDADMAISQHLAEVSWPIAVCKTLGIFYSKTTIVDFWLFDSFDADFLLGIGMIFWDFSHGE